MSGFIHNIGSLLPGLTGASFSHGWMLLGLLSLPLLWYVLRITPPAARIVMLPTARFLQGLIPKDQVPSRTPWIIFMLRLLIAALTIIGLAGPSLNPTDHITGGDPVRIILDNGWASAQTWDNQIGRAHDIINEADLKELTVDIFTTAPREGSSDVLHEGPLTPQQARTILDGINPLPWAADYTALAKRISTSSGNDFQTFWIAHGLSEGNIGPLLDDLKNAGSLVLMAPAPEQRPILLADESKTGVSGFAMKVIASSPVPENAAPLLQAFNTRGRVVDQARPAQVDGALMHYSFTTPASQRNQITHVKIQGRSGAGATYMFDTRYQKKLVGLITASEDEKPKPFVEARYYITRALEPFAKITTGSVSELIKKKPSVIILNDSLMLSAESLNALENWIRDGGLFIRFGGPDLAQAGSQSPARSLLPVAIRGGERSLGGDVTWDTPRKLKSFSENSPLLGIDLPEDILVKQQILAVPDESLSEKTWAELEDGTPLVTASTLGSGLLVFIHTAPLPGWSDLVLSGVFVEIMQRLVNLGGQTQRALSAGSAQFKAIRVMDGFGHMQEPGPHVRSLAFDELETVRPGPTHPPGLYESRGQYFALNIARHIPLLIPIEEAAGGMDVQYFGRSNTLDLMPYFLTAALVLLLVDWLIVMIMAGGFRRLVPSRILKNSMIVVTMVVTMVIVISTPLDARAAGDQDGRYASDLYLAYIKTGDTAVDALSERGLQNLAAIARNRTSVEPEGVIGVDPERDALVFFPLIYWPITASQPDLSPETLQAVQHYLDHGGTIIFDTRDGATSGADGLSAGTTSVHGARLARILQPLTIPSLEPLPRKHVLLRSFYLLKTTPGRLDDGNVWVETKSAPGRDGVSSVIIGSNDWAGAWSEGQPNEFGEAGSAQQEQAFRFGINLLMYALTGNYKEDQVHVQNILERLEP